MILVIFFREKEVNCLIFRFIKSLKLNESLIVIAKDIEAMIVDILYLVIGNDFGETIYIVSVATVITLVFDYLKLEYNTV